MTGPVAFERESSYGEADRLPDRYYFRPCADDGINYTSYFFEGQGRTSQTIRGFQVGTCQLGAGETGTITTNDGGVEWIDTVLTRYVPDQTVELKWSGQLTGRSLGLTAAAIERITAQPFAAWKVAPEIRPVTGPLRIVSLLAALDADDDDNTPLDPIYLESIVVAIIRATSALPEEQWRRSATLSSDQVRRVRSLVAENLGEPLSLRAMAEAVGLSEGYFVRAFRGSFDVTPYQFLLRERVKLAQNMIGTSDLPLNDIALRCGFPDARRMGRTFRQITGRSPSKSRKNR